jgi:GT2 family glycosyltransferase
MYYPGAEITHFKGECSKFNYRKAAFEFYRSMYLFHKKHFAKSYNPVINIIIYTGIFLKALASWRGFLFSIKVRG